MKILLVSQEYPPETAHGGIASQTYLKAQGLAGLGHNVCVLSHSIDEQTHEIMDKAVRVIRIPGDIDNFVNNNEETRWLNYSRCVAAKIHEINARETLDLIDFVEWGAEGFIYLLNRTVWSRIPSVVHIQGPLVMLSNTIGWPQKDTEIYRIGSFMEGTCLRLADAIYSSSQYSADWCRKSYALDQAEIPVIHAGVDTGSFYPRNVPKAQNPTIIFVGRIAESKGVSVLFQAALKLAKEIPDLRLQLIGRCDDGLLDRIKGEAREAGFPELVDAPGFIPKDQLPEYLSRSIVFAAPSFCEGGPGFVYLEAMACGLPVIGCSGSGINETVQNGKTGYLVPPKDVQATVQALRALIMHESTRAEMSQNAQDYVKHEVSTDICVKKIEHFYQSVLSKKDNKVGA